MARMARMAIMLGLFIALGLSIWASDRLHDREKEQARGDRPKDAFTGFSKSVVVWVGMGILLVITALQFLGDTNRFFSGGPPGSGP